jgi:hypothetical protein
LKITKEAPQRSVGHECTAYFVADKDDVRFGPQRHTRDFRQSAGLNVAFRLLAVLPAKIAQPDSEAIQEKEVAFTAVTLNGSTDFKRRFDRAPVRRPLAAVFRDPRLHFRVFGPCRSDVERTLRTLTQRLGETAFAAACAADNERDHGRGERASRFCSRDALG